MDIDLSLHPPKCTSSMAEHYLDALLALSREGKSKSIHGILSDMSSKGHLGGVSGLPNRDIPSEFLD
jgi:hypothetical protein